MFREPKRDVVKTDLDAYRAIIARHDPALADAPMRMLSEGWDNVAVEAEGRFIFRFPRSAELGQPLVREQAILERVRPYLSLRVPELILFDGPPIVSRHTMIPGEHLTPEAYSALPEERRRVLGETLGRFYAELHAIPPAIFDDLPPVEFAAEPTADEIAAELESVMTDDLRDFASETLERKRTLEPDIHGNVFCFFDGHGYNMAFDHERGVLNGLYDFADARIAPLQHDFIYTNFIASDLTRRVIAAYERLTGRTIDRQRVDLLFSILLVKELSGWRQNPEKLPLIRSLVRRWVKSADATTHG